MINNQIDSDLIMAQRMQEEEDNSKLQIFLHYYQYFKDFCDCPRVLKYLYLFYFLLKQYLCEVTSFNFINIIPDGLNFKVKI